MAQLTPKQESIKRQDMIRNEWEGFSKTAAYKEFMEYIELQDYFAVMAAKGPVMPFDEEKGTDFIFDNQKSANLLQRSVGYDIVKAYVYGYVNPTTL